MRHVGSLLAGVTLVAVAASAPAFAGVPTPPYLGPAITVSTVPAIIRLVGRAGVTPDSLTGRFVIRIGRFLNPVTGSMATVDFSGTPDLHFASEQPWNNAYPQLAADCTRHVATAITDTQGYAIFTIVGDARGFTAASNTHVNVYADGVFFGSVPVVAYDLDGTGGVGAGDLSLWLQAFGTGAYIGALDYDQDATLGANDLAQWLSVFGSGQSAQSSASVCP